MCIRDSLYVAQLDAGHGLLYQRPLPAKSGLLPAEKPHPRLHDSQAADLEGRHQGVPCLLQRREPRHVERPEKRFPRSRAGCRRFGQEVERLSLVQDLFRGSELNLLKRLPL